MTGSLAAMALLTAAFAAPAFVGVAAAMAGFGFFIAWFFVGGSTTRQNHTPGELMGRVYGAISLVMQASQAAGNALGALLVVLLFYRNLVYLCAAALALTALYLTALKPREATTHPPTMPGNGRSPRPCPSPSAGGDPSEAAPGARSVQRPPDQSSEAAC